MASFGISGVEPSNFVTRESHIREMCCEDGRWMELAQDRCHWGALLLVALKLGVLLPES
jgi:hypothetical protein